MKKAYFIVIHIVLIALLGCTSDQPQQENQLNQKRIVPVVVGNPRIADIAYRVSFTGEITGEEQATAFSDVPGRFLQYLVAEGQYVERQTPLALVERELAGLEFQPVQVDAPISGVVGRFPLERGESISPLTPIAKVAKIGRVKVLFDAPEVYARGITRGKEVRVEVPSLETSFEGRISWVSTFLDPETRTVSAYVLIENKGRLLKPGMFAKAELVVEERREVLSVPSHAVLGFADKWVFVVDGGRAGRKEVEIGLDDGHRAEILSGLTGDDVIVTVGQEILEDGDTLKIVPAGGEQ